MILETLNQISKIKTKVDKAYILDETCKLGEFYPELLNIIFDKDVRFFVATEKVKEGLSGIMPIMPEADLDYQLLQLLKMLASEELRGNVGILKCINFADQLMPEEINMFINILENKTRLGIGATDINKLCQRFKIEQFKVMFAQRYDKVKKFDWEKGYCIQPKVDGMRCIGIKKAQEGIQFFTRTGKAITSLKHIEDQINRVMVMGDFVMDGEIESGTSLEETGAIRRKEEQAEDAVYTLFGIYSLEEWMTENHKEEYLSVYNNTINILRTYQNTFLNTIPNIRIIPSHNIIANNEEDFHKEVNKYYQEFLDQGYEGAVLKTFKHTYQPSTGTKRSSDWVKIKPQETTEGIVVEILEGEGEHKGMLGKFNVKWLDVVFEVAPGKLKHNKRKEILENPEDYLGSEIEFRYQQLSIYGVPRHAYAVKFRSK